MALETTGPPRGELLRVGDSERQAVAQELQDHYAQGRLTWDELDQRLAGAWAARTQADLTPLLVDLPALGGRRAGPQPPAAERRLLDRQRGRGVNAHLLVWFLVLAAAIALVTMTDGLILIPLGILVLHGGRHHHRGHHQAGPRERHGHPNAWS